MRKLNIEFYKSVIPDLDHPALNSLRNASNSSAPIHVPVTLYSEGEKVLSADVSMIGTAIAQYKAALWLTLRALERADITVEWDECSFLSAQTKFARASCADFDDDALVPHMRADAALSFKDVFIKASESLLSVDDAADSQESLDNFAYRITASVILHSAAVDSADINALKGQKSYFTRAKNIFKSRLLF
tara:strand:+ start:132164 stop:132733 length:570 start_codon:yes stop_codon:yes gene_type:complete